jgi:DNA-binding transcriptional ArsR family regulator
MSEGGKEEVYIPWLDDAVAGAALVAGGRGGLRVLAALGEPTRYAIVDYLLELDGDGASAGDLAGLMDAKLPGMMHHLAVLKRAGVLKQAARRRGRTTYLPANGVRELLQAAGWIGAAELGEAEAART